MYKNRFYLWLLYIVLLVLAVEIQIERYKTKVLIKRFTTNINTDSVDSIYVNERGTILNKSI